MAQAGAFNGLRKARVAEVAYIGLGANPKFERISVGDDTIRDVQAGLVELIEAYQQRAQGYTARRVVESQRFDGDYDHLSRYGEWDHTDRAIPVEVGP